MFSNSNEVKVIFRVLNDNLLVNKANSSDVYTKLDTNNLLDGKANISYVSGALDLKANIASPTFTGTVSGITKAMVGLGSVDNTADSAKPVSTAQQTALDAKQDTINIINGIQSYLYPQRPLTYTDGSIIN